VQAHLRPLSEVARRRFLHGAPEGLRGVVVPAERAQLTGTKETPTSVPPQHAQHTTFRAQQADGHVGGELN
jgi:hypothetical protein